MNNQIHKTDELTVTSPVEGQNEAKKIQDMIAKIKGENSTFAPIENNPEPSEVESTSYLGQVSEIDLLGRMVKNKSFYETIKSLDYGALDFSYNEDNEEKEKRQDHPLVFDSLKDYYDKYPNEQFIPKTQLWELIKEKLSTLFISQPNREAREQLISELILEPMYQVEDGETVMLLSSCVRMFP